MESTPTITEQGVVVPETVTQEVSDTKKKPAISAKVASKITFNDDIKDIEQFQIHISSTGEKFSTTERVVKGICGL
jgi:hypothetical protein